MAGHGSGDIASRSSVRLRDVFSKPAERIELERLATKDAHFPVSILAPEDWRRLVTADPAVPRSYGQLKRLSRQLFDKAARRKAKARLVTPALRRGILRPRIEECGESAYALLFAGLGNPFLEPQQRADIEADMDADTPTFENSSETTHFILRWTNASSNTADNIADSSIVTDTGGFLEDAWSTYAATFGRNPHVPGGATKIEVLFHDIAALGVASPPDGPIQFDAESWVAEPGIRRPTSAHELFHKLQYAFGYRTTWTPVAPYTWFSEGSASWAEVFRWSRVSRDYKVQDLFSNPDLNLYDATYRALPFWVFFEARQKSNGADQPMRNFLQRYESHGNEEQALAEAVADEWAPNNVHRTLPHFFALFARERWLGAWKVGPTGSVYGDIRGPDDTVLAPTATVVTVPLDDGDMYSASGSVSALGTDYYRLDLGATTAGQTLNVAVDGATGGDFSYYLIWQKAGKWKRASFPFAITTDLSHAETIDLAQADQLVIAVSGRGTGGAYSLTATIA
jgi:hypothetical protein